MKKLCKYAEIVISRKNTTDTLACFKTEIADILEKEQGHSVIITNQLPNPEDFEEPHFNLDYPSYFKNRTEKAYVYITTNRCLNCQYHKNILKQ